MNEPAATPPKLLGFWSCWALAVGTMIGSGIFLLPAALAPYGMLSFGGWILGGLGTIALGLVFGRLASRTTRDGGPYIYVQEAFGDLAGFLMAWGYWISFWISIPVVAIAFVGYLGVFVPGLSANPIAQALAALALIAVFTLVNIRGLKEMSAVQIAMTVLKIIPLVAIVGVALFFGAPRNLPPFNPSHAPILPSLAAVTLITLWPFTGFETAVTSASSVRDCARTIPRALTAAILLVTAIYLATMFGVMLLVPADQLARSQAPFVDAAHALGPWGAGFIAIGAMIATAGTLNGIVFTSGQMLMAVAEDGKAPRWLATLNKGGAPYIAILISSIFGAILLLMNYSRGFIGAYTFLLMMATAVTLIYYFFSALAELKHSWRAAKGWTLLALFACLYALFAMVGSGLEVLFWGGVLMLAGVPLFFLFRSKKPASLASQQA
ncbi:MAG TPA: amino acid permease [Caulobacterales bacterium]|nr:amino acid permease [Caulobacterales bacterium]